MGARISGTKMYSGDYADKAACVAHMESIPPGVDAGAATESGDTQACRMYHLSVAMSGADDAEKLANAEMHCPHASEAGGGVCVASGG